MTSPSPRKPPIIPRLTPTTTDRLAVATGHARLGSARLAVWLCAAALPCLAAAPAMADSPGVRSADYVTAGDDAPVVQVGYSVGKSGHRLKWLPGDPTPGKAAIRHTRTTAGPALRAAERVAVDPFDDPFGDTIRLSQATESQPGSLSDQLLQVPPPAAPKMTPPPAAPQIPPPPAAPRTLPEQTTPPPPPRAPAAKPREPALQGESSQKSEQVAPKSSELEALIAAGPEFGKEECKTPSEVLRPIGELTDDASVRADKGLRKSDRMLPRMCELGGEFQPRLWAPSTFMWKASGLCHKPAYFDDPQLERYGHSWGPYVQPLVSGAHFFLTVPILPYKMGLYPPDECVYTLGYYRPGSCTPYLLDPLPLSVRAALVEAGAWTGMALLIP